MQVRLGRWGAALALSTITLVARAAPADEAPAQTRLGRDTFIAGAEVRLDVEAAGDVALAGETVTVSAPVRGDALIFGAELELAAPFGADLYAAGGEVRLDGDVAGNARIAGGQVSIGPGSRIEGALSVAAARAEIEGEIGEYLQVAAGSTELSGHVGGDLDVSGAQLRLAPGAVVEGKLTFRGPEPAIIDAGASVRGEVVHLPPDDGSSGRFGLLLALLAGALWWLGAALVGALLWALWPGFVRETAAVARQRTAAALLIGLGVAGGVPLAVAVLFVSLLGIPLGILLGYLYLLLFPLGYLVSAAAITEVLLPSAGRESPKLGQRLFAFFPVLLALALLPLVPFVGLMAMALLVLIGMGSLMLSAVARYRHGRRVPLPITPEPAGAHFPPASEPGSRPATGAAS